jgi:hypothetical protein
VINRSVSLLGPLPPAGECPWLVPLLLHARSPEAREAMVGIHRALARRQARERSLVERLGAPSLVIDDGLLLGESASAAVVRRAAEALACHA